MLCIYSFPRLKDSLAAAANVVQNQAMTNDVQKNKGGRPRKIATPEEFERLAKQYFNLCDDREENYLVTGLALALGLCSRSELFTYQNYEGFEQVVQWARSKVESAYEKNLSRKDLKATGSIFALKNMGWRDERHVDVTSTDGSMSPVGNVTVMLDVSKLTTDQLAAVYGALTVSENAPNAG